MNKKLFKLLAIAACSLTFATTLSAGISSTLDNVQSAKAYEITFDSEDAFAETYAQGSTITIPMGTIQGVKATDFVVISPSGNGYNSKEITFNEAGDYTIRWYATVGGEEVYAEKTFNVTQNAFKLQAQAEAEYMENLSLYNGHSGVKVTLPNQATFNYNGVVDLRDSGEFIHLFPYFRIINLEEYRSAEGAKEEAQYYADARNYYVTLTDCYDPTKSITIDIEWQEGRTYYNLKAGPTGYVSHGLRSLKDGATPVDVDGTEYGLYLAPSQGMTQFNAVKDYGVKLYYDVEINNIRSVYYRYYDGQLEKYDKIFADVDNPTIYPSQPFTGFTTGEVFVSITAGTLVSSEAHVEIASIGGRSGQEIVGAVDDEKAPVIKLDEKLANMDKIALNETISVPDAFATDPNMSDDKAKASVYYNYNPNSATNTLVGLVNGKFTPKKTGNYTIVYTATDFFGNVGTKTVELECVNVTEGKAVNLTVASPSMEAGMKVDVPACTITGLYTNNAELEIYYTNKNGEEVLYTEDSIFLDYVGEFKFTYVYKTPFATYTETAIITAIETDNVILTAPILPKYFIQNAKYTLEPVTATLYTANGNDAAIAKVYMKADGGEYVEVDAKAVTIPVASTVQFKYVHGTGMVESDPVKVLDVGFGGTLSAKDYFYSEADSFTKNATGSYVEYITKGSPVEASMDYINPLAMSSFDIEFTFPSTDKEGTTEYVAPGDITFTFTDFYDRSNVATFKMRPVKAGLFIDINGVEKVGQIAKRKFLDIKTYFNYSNGVIKFEGNEYNLGTTFTDDRFLLTVTMNDVENGESCMRISLLSDCRLTSSKVDTARPKLNVPVINTGYHQFDSVITVSKAIASDIIAPYVEAGLSLKVTMPDGTYAVSEDGVTLDGTCSVTRDYQLKLDQVGFYNVLYTYVDQNGGTQTFAYSPIVKDEQGPTITVDGRVEGETISGKWGSTISVATYSVTDDISSSENVRSFINVIYPSAIMREVTNGSFYAEEKGKYQVVYFAFDEVGNASLFTYYIIVS